MHDPRLPAVVHRSLVGLTALAVIATLSACGETRAPVQTPTASPTSSPTRLAVHEPLCPSTADVAGSTGLPLRRAAPPSGASCAYTERGGTALVLRRPASASAPRNSTLSSARQDLESDPSVRQVTDATQLAVPGFVVRSRNRACAVWVYAVDGRIESVSVRQPGAPGERSCTLATRVAALVGSVPTTAETAAQPIVAVLAPPSLGRAWTAQLTAVARLRLQDDPGTGDGFLTTEGSSRTFEQAARQVDPRAAAVLFVSGSADVSGSRVDVARAAGLAFAAATRAAPRARLVVVGPVDAGGSPTPRTYDLRTALRAAARIAGATFIDPIQSGWSAGPVPRGTFSAREATALVRSVAAALRADVLCRRPVPAATVHCEPS